MSKKIAYLSIIFFFGLFLSSCSLINRAAKPSDSQVPEATVNESQNDGADLVYSGQMKKFSNYDELRSFLEKKTVSLPNYSISNSSSGSHSLNDSYLIPSLQDIGIYEPDIVKIEGEYIYAVSYNDIFIIKASENSIQVLAKLTLYSRPSELYVNNGKLLVIGVDTEIMDAQVYKGFRRQSPYTFVKIFNLQDPANPMQIRDLDFEGSYLESRVIDNQLYLILDNFNEYVVGEPLVPRLVDEGRILQSVCGDSSACFAPAVFYFDAPYDNRRFVSINTLDLTSATEPVEAQTYILNSAQNIYVSAKNVYLTYAKGINLESLQLTAMQSVLSNKLSANESAQVDKIRGADSLILSPAEKINKLLQIYNNFLNNRGTDELLIFESELDSLMSDSLSKSSDSQSKTLIYKLNLNGKLPVYQAKGEVAGLVKDSIIDEDVSGNLRLMTTNDKNSGLFSEKENIASNFYILSPQLSLLSSIESFITNQTIYAARFLGSHIYLNTLDQSDGLYIIDTANVKAPKLLGKLKLTDPLAYLYPYDDNTLISFGRDIQLDAYGNKKFGGIKLALLDITDINNPLELDSYTTGSMGSDSLALYNYKDFLFSANKNFLAVPATLSTGTGSLRNYFDGSLFFSIESGKLILRDKVDHSDGGKYQLLDSSCAGDCYNSSVKRIVYIGNLLYTFSNKYIKVNSLSDFSLRQILKLIPDTDLDVSAEIVSEPIIKVNLENGVNANSDNQSMETLPPIGPILPQENLIKTDNADVLEDVASSSDLIVDEVLPIEDDVNTPEDLIDNADEPVLDTPILP